MVAFGLFLLAAGCKDSSGPESQILVRHSGASTRVYEDLRVRECGTELWGDDLLAGSARVAPGESRTFRLRPGCYDLLIRIGQDVETTGPAGIIRHGLQVRSGATTEFEVP